MSYWSKRQEELNKALEKDEAKLKKRLAKMYAEETRRLERQIAAYYEMYGEDDVIAYRKLLEDLSEEDKRLLMEEMDEFAEKYPEYRDLMPIRESVYNLDRLEGLQYSVQMQQLRIGAKEQDMIKQHLIENAYHSANAAAEAMGFGTKFYSMNSNIMSRFVGVPWADGRSFSDRIWDNKKKLTNYLSRDLAQGMARGDSYEQLVKNITERFGKVSKNDAYRLVYTEGTYVMAESSMMPFEEDFQFYKLSTVGDDKVCSICRGLENGDPMPIDKRVPGENFPPLHPWCRCTFTIEVEDWDKWMDDYVAKHGQSTADEAGRIGLRISSPGSPSSLKKSLDGIRAGKAGLSRRRRQILNRVPVSGSHHRFEHEKITINDLAYLSAETGHEFSLFRGKNEDILFHGDARHCHIDEEMSNELIEHGYEWVGHSHIDIGPLNSSKDDRETLKKLGQKTSIIIGPDGKQILFFQELF